MSEKILKAIEAVAESGQKPTNSNVRAKLGGGSLSTIAPVLRNWKASREAAEGEHLPESVAVVAEEAIKRVWSAAKAEAKAEFEAASAGFQVQIDEALAESAEFEAESKQIADDLQARDAELAEVNTTVVETQKKNAELEVLLAERSSELERLREQVAGLQSELVSIATGKAARAASRAKSKAKPKAAPKTDGELSEAQAKPWEAMGITRRTYYRRKKAGTLDQ